MYKNRTVFDVTKNDAIFQKNGSGVFKLGVPMTFDLGVTQEGVPPPPPPPECKMHWSNALSKKGNEIKLHNF